MTYWVYRDPSLQYRWRLRADNQRIIANSGEAYHNRTDCLAAIELVKNSKNAPVRDE